MPARFTVRTEFAHASYHVMNRGAFKLALFREPRDYWIFRRILRKVWESMDSPPRYQAYALMPNHYHFELFQDEPEAIRKYIKSAWTRYAMYFVKKYNHCGRLRQGTYKSVFLGHEKKQQQVREYIWENPRKAGLTSWEHVGKRPW